MATGTQYYEPDLRDVKVNSNSTVYSEYPPSGYSSQLAGIPKYSRMDSVTIRVSWYTHNLPGGNIYLMMGDTQIGNGDTVQNTTKSFTHNVTSYFNSVNASSGYPKSTPRVKLTSGVVSRTVKVENFQISWSYTLPTFTISATAGTGGTVSGDIGTYDVTTTNQTKTITATPNTGYKFAGWKDSSGTVVSTNASMSITISHNSISAHSTTVSYTATFEPSTYYVRFSGYGATSGINSAPSAITATYGKSYTLPTPSSATFFKQVTVTWNGNADDATLSFTESKPTCYCIGWKRDPNSSTMYQPGESVSIEPTTEGEDVTFYATWGATSANNPSATRPGYRLKEWNTKADGTGTPYTGSTIETSEDITLYAQWEKNTCTITVQPNNTAYGSVTGGGTYDVGATATITATPNTGYKFVQWGDGNTSATRTFTVSADATYIARFEPITYYVAFDGNGATSGSVATLTVKYGETFYLPENGFERKVTLTWDKNADDAGIEWASYSLNCGFKGWKFGSETKSPGTSFSNFTSTDGKTITFYADWDYCRFTHPTATRKGYKFKEWNEKADGSGTAYTTSVLNTQTTRTLYAQWEKAEPVFTSVTITRSTDLAQVTINTPVEAGTKYIISVEVT